MKYLVLIYAAEGTDPQPGTPEFDTMIEGYGAASACYVKEGAMLGGAALQPIAMSTTLRIRDGKTETMDGPFAETKEQLGGFYLLDCADLDAAIRYAEMIPTAKYGCVEIRPIQEYDV